MRESRKFYFSVEGDTEKWYLEWLRDSINTSKEAIFNVKFDCKIDKDPLSRVKGMSVLGKTEIAHIFDRESEEPIHVRQFETTLERMKEAQNIGKNIKYTLGYCNFSFDLWMVLHKEDSNGSLNYRHQYLSQLKRAFQEKFSSMDDYKKEDNFKRLLEKLSLTDVWDAVGRAKMIEKRNVERGYILNQHCGHTYFTENPSLSIWTIVENILTICKIPSVSTDL